MNSPSAPATCPEIVRLLEELASLQTQFDVFRFMRKLGEHYGCSAFLVSQLLEADVAEISGRTIITNWPSELLTLYDKSGLIPTSPMIKKLRNTTIPFTFTMQELAQIRGNDSVKELFERFGMDSGAVFPVADMNGIRGAVVFCGMGVNLVVQQMMELSYFAIHVYQHLMVVSRSERKQAEPLAEREISCLVWTAAGKTSAEIADILTLSEHTVNHYLNRATKKLDAVNRTQTVAKAIRMGLIK